MTASPPLRFRPAALLMLLLSLAGAGPVMEQSPAGGASEFVVTIRSRIFEPASITVPAGRPITLVFQNQDAELHVFAPGVMFKGINLALGGNGAPEFDPDGLKRVIIPSQGRVELRFVHSRPGRYRYTCDMPGHDMRAEIVVE